jgi:hypothetical protein
MQLIPTMMAKVGTVISTATSSIGGAVSAGGTLLSTAGAVAAASNAKKMGKYQAALADKRAKEEKALSIKKSQEHQRRGRIALSRARAVGAASGGGLDYDLAGDLAEESELRTLNTIWEGGERASNLQQQGREALFEGRSKRKAGYLKAGKTLLGGTASLMDTYGT